jgi:ribosomal protein S18 acetylase RimI-like enzyme
MDTLAGLRIREFRYPDDYPAARELWSRSGPGVQVRRSDEPAELEKKLTRDPDLFLVAERDGRLVGTVIGGFDGRRGMIYHLAVDENLRGAGIGGLLMEAVEQRLRAKGCLRCYLMVTTGNETAMRFYEGRGWSRMETVHTYAKDLDPQE